MKLLLASKRRGQFTAPIADLSALGKAPKRQLIIACGADKSAMGTLMDFNKFIWTCRWVCGGR